ncbi:hypothetical protein PFISCL1PPCAC_1147, partial [Pristionchus fissidentatus]
VRSSIEKYTTNLFQEAERESESRSFEQRFAQSEPVSAPPKSILKSTNIQPSQTVADTIESPPPSPAPPSPSVPRSTNQQPQNEGPKTASAKCMHYPHCDPPYGEICNFLHPTIECRNFGTPNCPGVYCRFIHPICPNDERKCNDNDCVYHHVKSTPTLLRRHGVKMNAE